ncbi:MAG TPA: AMP-binding protein, partial [Pseudonocardiaceae bacterium]|nr:AMP-binding protein [Pseudonocardiaceae bacterium]
DPETAAAGGRQLRAALTNALVFDASWSQLLWMVAGHELHMISDEVRADPQALLDYIAAHQIDVLDTTPSFARALIAAGLLDSGPEGRPAIGTLALGGEAIDDALWTRLRETEGLSVYNLYGPAECTVDAMFSRIAEHDHQVIGTAADNLLVYLLDENLRPIPSDVDGELYLAGAGLARGYLGRARLSAERFVADPFGRPGTRMYRTGDRGRWQADGVVAFTGRADDQIKIRGFRVEPAEIEAALTSADEVASAVVIAREDQPGTPRLVGYVVPETGARVDTEALRTRLAAVLPDYMVPSAVVALDELPVTVNGKVDKAALPAPAFVVEPGGGLPRDEREQQLCDLFAEVLGLETVGINDNFFNLGGDSILSMQLAARARRSGLRISPRDVFVGRTVAALAALPSVAGDEEQPALPTGPLITLTDEERAEIDAGYPDAVEVLPLTPLQQGMSFHALLAPDRIDPYVTQQALELTGELAPAVLESAFDALLARHANLRSCFVRCRSGRSVQVVLPAAKVPWHEADLTNLDPTQQRARIDELLGQEHDRRFDTATAPLLRVLLIRLATDRHLLVVTDHHMLLDGWSVPLLYRDLFELYGRGGDATGMPEITPFRDFLAWRSTKDADTAEAAWVRAFESFAEPTFVAPTADLSASAVQGTAEHDLDAATTAALTGAARAAGLTVNSLLHGAWALTLEALTGNRDVAFGASVSGREPELPGAETIVGLIMNTVPVRAALDPAEPLADALVRMQTEQSGLIAHHHLGLADLQRAVGKGELFDTIVGFENANTDHSSVAQQVPGLGIALHESTVPGTAHYPLRLLVRPGERLNLKLHYRADIYDQPAAEGILARVLRMLTTFLDAPRTLLGRVDLLTESERDTLLTGWAHGAPAKPAATIPAMFAARVAEHPDAPAVRTDSTTLTYAELDARANRLARVLLGHGAGPDRIVAVLMPRTVEMVVTILAIWKTGATHMPVDADYPADRIEFMVTDARPDLVLAGGAAVDVVPEQVRDRMLALDELVIPDGTSAADITDADRLRPLTPACGAYVIYTSGSTGKPKGVLVTHAGLASFLATQRDNLDIGPGRRVLWFASPSFDGAMGELNTALLSGSCVVLGTFEQMLPGQPLADWVAATGVQTMTVPPSSLAAMPEGS